MALLGEISSFLANILSISLLIAEDTSKAKLISPNLPHFSWSILQQIVLAFPTVQPAL
jgi:hypothetical protein